MGKLSLGRVIALAVMLAVSSTVLAPASVALAADAGYRDFSFAASGVSAPTGQKPQSKLWFAGGAWWGALFSKTADSYTVHELDWGTQRWRDTGVVLEPRNTARLDVLFDGASLYVASAGTSTASADSLEIRRLSFDPIARQYSLDVGFPVTVVSGGMEAAVIDKDSTGKVWATWTRGNAAYVTHTTTDDQTWTTPFVIPTSGASNLASDDLSAVVAFDGKIGVMWSNQNDSAMYFAIHVDGDPDSAWIHNPAVQDPGYADDHLNLKSLQADTEGRVYAVTKTSLSASSAPLLLVLVLDRNGSWKRTTFGTVADNHTRPLLLIDQQNKQLYVFAASPCCSGGSIYYKQTSLDNPSFETGLGTPFIQSSTDTTINNPASTKQALDATTGLVVIAGDDHSKYYLHNAISLGADTTPPDTVITSAPADPSAAQQAVFDVTSTEPGSTFECQLDGASWTGCTSPMSYPSISEGPHTFAVQATDAAGNTDPTPAAHAWTVSGTSSSGTQTLSPTADTWVDQRYPTTTHGSAATLESDAGTGVIREAYLRFDTSAVPGSVSAAKLRIFATNGTGNGPAIVPTVVTWDEAAVNWNTKPAATGPAGADAGAIAIGTYYDYDVTSLVAAGTAVSLGLIPQSTDGLDFDSREGANPPQLIVDWVASGGDGDTTPPDTTITDGPSGVMASADASFTFSSEPDATFECRLDGATWASCTSPASFSGLADGNHVFDARATDLAGNTDPTPASRSWAIDTAIPTVVAVSPADGATEVAVDTVVTVRFSEAVDAATVNAANLTLTESGAAVPASVTYDAATWTATLAPAGALAASAAHAVSVSGIADLAGNVVTPFSWSFATAAAPARATIVAAADAYVDERKPTRNFGTRTTLTSDFASGASKVTYVRFNVDGIPATLTSARLRLWVTNGSTNGPELFLADNAWTETGITWASRPAPGALAGDAGPVATDTWLDYDVTGSVTGNGTFAFALSSVSTDATSMASRETASPPALVLEWAAP